MLRLRTHWEIATYLVAKAHELARTEILVRRLADFWGVLPRLPRIGPSFGGAFNESVQHEPRMEVSWCDDVARG